MAFSTFSTINSMIKIKKNLKPMTSSILTSLTAATGIFAISRNGQSIVHVANDATRTVNVSTDYGLSFTKKNNYPKLGIYSCLRISNTGTYIMMSSSSNSFYTGVNGCYISKDGGGSWTGVSLTSGSNTLIDIPAIWADMSDDGNYIFILIQNNGGYANSSFGGMWKSTNQGVSFSQVNTLSSNNMDATLSSDGHFLTFLTYNAAYLMISYNYGTTWVQTSNSALNFGGQGIYMSGDKSYIFSVGDDKFGLWNITGAWTSTNYSGSWTTTPSLVKTSIGSISNDTMRMAVNNDGSKMYIIKSNNEIWVSTDKLKSSANFTKLISSTTSTYVKMVASTNCKYILTCTGTNLYLTTQPDVVEI